MQKQISSQPNNLPLKFLKSKNLVAILLGLVLGIGGIYFLALPAQAQGGTYYVATDGDNDNDGQTPGTAWATITYAAQNVPDGSTILVQPGTYDEDVDIRGEFTQGIVIKSAVPYQARLRYTNPEGDNPRSVVRIWYAQGVTLEGFDIAHSPGNTAPLVIQVQDLLGDSAGIGDGSDPVVSRITLRNNIIHDSTNNDLLKVNNGARDVVVEGNLFYNQRGSDEHIDINSVVNVVVQDNVFFNDFTNNQNNTSSYIVIKDSNQDDDGLVGTEQVTVRRNIFFNWQGSTSTNFLLVGEDAHAYHAASNVLVENNLMLGNAANLMRSSFGVKGARDIVFRHNTVVGDLPARTFAMRLNIEGSNPNNQNIRFYNNIWSDPTGTMGTEASNGLDFAEVSPAENSAISLDHNLYWNGGNPIPPDPGQLIHFTDDANRLVADPLLGSQAGLVIPRWDANSNQFADGSTTIRAVFERLAGLYGKPAANSPVFGAADPGQSPADDILGNPRDGAPDLGAFEGQPALSVTPSFQAIDPGDTATFIVHVASGEPVTLTAVSPSPDLTLSLAPTQLTPPGGQATLVVTSTHPGPDLTPGLLFTIPISATGSELNESTSAQLLVGGTGQYLPVIIK